MVPNTTPVVPALMDSIVFGPASAGNGSTVPPTPAPSLFDSASGAAGASERPMVADSAVGEGPQQGDPNFTSQQIAPNRTPDYYRDATDQAARG